MSIDRLNAVELPDSLGIDRELLAGADHSKPGFKEKYDYRTLFYDAFYLPKQGSICLVCPKLLNLRDLIETGEFLGDGQNLTLQAVHEFQRHDELWLQCPARPDTLTFRSGAFEVNVSVSTQDESFSGLRCAFLQSKDNELVWLRDWADYTVRVHGLQGVVLFDNGSSKYSLEEVDRTLGQVDGLEAVRVLSIPQPYGPWKGKFLPSGALNIARLRYFASAASVLVTDIDELVTPGRDGGIFEAAERSPLGYVRLRGSWRYPKRVKAGSSSRHADHVYRRIFPSHPGGTIEARKYCVCPTGPLGDRRWVLHRVILDRTDRRKIERSVETDQFEYWHCRLITTDWKYPREVPARYKLRHDPATQRVMESVFGRGTRPQRS